MAINKQIKGSNLCETSCIEKKNVIHPETCVNQVLIDDSSEKTLREWILNAAEPATLGTYRCLKDWLLINYPVSGEPQDIPHADSTHYGVIKTGEGNQYLTLNDGVLTFNYSELPQLRNATFTTLGGVKLGNNGTVSGTFTHEENYSDITYPTGSFSNFYGFPLSLDANNKAGVVIPQELFSGRVQSDWNTSDNTDSSYIRNKPNLATVATTGSYNDLTNKPTIPAAQIQSDWNQTDNTAVDYIKNKPIFSLNEYTATASSLQVLAHFTPLYKFVREHVNTYNTDITINILEITRTNQGETMQNDLLFRLFLGDRNTGGIIRIINEALRSQTMPDVCKIKINIRYKTLRGSVESILIPSNILTLLNNERLTIYELRNDDSVYRISKDSSNNLTIVLGDSTSGDSEYTFSLEINNFYDQCFLTSDCITKDITVL